MPKPYCKNYTKCLGNEKCLNCKHLDTSDIPNLFCNLSAELVNDGDFRYCPKNPQSVIEFVEKQDYQIQELQKENSKLVIMLAMQEKEDRKHE